MKTRFKALIIFLQLLSQGCVTGSVLQAPKSINDAQVSEIASGRNSGMNFLFGDDLVLSFDYSNQQTKYTVTVSDSLRSKLGDIEGLQKDGSVFRKCLGPCIFYPLKRESKPGSGGGEYYFAKPLVIDEAKPKSLTREELLEKVQAGKYMIYTGAGLSYGKVMTMKQLEESLKLKGFNPTDLPEFTIRALQNMEYASKVMNEFYRSMISGEPTAAHFGVKELVLGQKVPLLTENLDLLHHRTGILPIGPPSPKELKGRMSLDQVNFVLCMGLSHDDRGLLAYMRQLKPDLEFVAVDLGQPRYLGNEDYLVKFDLQEIIPWLAAEVKATRGHSSDE